MLALSTGLRQSNVVKLEWSQVDQKRQAAWIHPDQAKGVFTYRGRPVINMGEHSCMERRADTGRHRGL